MASLTCPVCGKDLSEKGHVRCGEILKALQPGDLLLCTKCKADVRSHTLGQLRFCGKEEAREQGRATVYSLPVSFIFELSATPSEWKCSTCGKAFNDHTRTQLNLCQEKRIEQIKKEQAGV